MRCSIGRAFCHFFAQIVSICSENATDLSQQTLIGGGKSNLFVKKYIIGEISSTFVVEICFVHVRE
jgi:hypothetical protein